MATLNIGGKRVKVDDSFLSLSPEQQNTTVEEIAASLKGAPTYEGALANASRFSRSLGGAPVKKNDEGGSERSTNVQGLDAQGGYDFALDRVQREYLPNVQKDRVGEMYAPYDTGQLLNAGLTFGFNDEAAGAANALGEATRGKDFGKAFNDYSALERARKELGAEKAGGLGVAAEIGGSLLAGRPDMAATRVAGLVPTMVEGAKGGAVGGGLYGFGSTDGDLGERVGGATKGAAGGALIGAAIPATVAGVKKAISPARASQAKIDAANVLRNEGVELTAGQATGNQNLMFREAELGGRAAQDFAERQADQFTAASLSRIGVNAPRATHDVLATAADDIGRAFDDTAARNFIQPDQRMATDLQSAWRRFEGSTNPSTRPPVIQRIIADIYGKGNGQRMTGEWYKSTRSELGRLSKSQNPELAEAARDLQHALDDAMERTIRQHNPADLGAWQEARRLYRNLLVIEDAATRAGAESAEGVITPQALRSAAIRQNKRAFARGRNDFVELADAGVSSMPKLPNSGIAGRLGARLFVPAGAATGAGVGGAVGGPVGAGVGALAGAAIPWAAGRAILSGPGRAYLTNQLAAKPVGGLAALLGGSVARGAQPLLD